MDATDGTRLIFDCPFSPWVIGIVSALILGVLSVFVLRDMAHLRRRLQMVIMGLIVVAALMLTGLLLRPKFIRTRPDPQKPPCIILVDGSRSMLLEDHYTDSTTAWLKQRLGPLEEMSAPRPTREKVAQLLLAEPAGGWVASLRKSFDLSGWRFSSELAALPLGEGVPSFEVNQEGYTTALGDALYQAAQGDAGLRPQAVVLISDGAWNTGRDPSEVARLLGRLGTPVFVVGVGNPNPPRDVAVLALRGPESALLGDEIFFTAQIVTSGMEARRIVVDLLNSKGDVVAEKEVVTLPSGRPLNVSFSVTPEEVGRQAFTAAVARQEDEQDDANNTANTSVTIVERKVNVLLIEGEPRWEFRFLRNVLERDSVVSLTMCLLRPGVGPVAGKGYLSTLPTRKRELSEYELVILGDVPRKLMPEPFLNALADMVQERSAGLLLVAGKRNHYRELIGSPLASVLPVRLEGALGAGLRSSPPFKAELTHEGLSHLITQLAPEVKENEAIWSRLPELHWCARVGGLVRGATALMVHPYQLAGTSKLPLLAVHRVGRGKVLFIGMEETWRWRKSLGDKYHYRFWAEAVRWMIKKPLSEDDARARLSIDRTECSVGETVEVEAYCLGPDGFPLENAQVWLMVQDPEGRSQQLAMTPAPGGWGIYRARFLAKRPGKHQMQPIVSVYGREPLSSSVTLEVVRTNLEKVFLAQDKTVLSAIAQASNGKYLEVSEVNQLPALLAARIERRFLTAEYSPCRHWVYYVILAAMVSVAWLVRKRSGLA